MKPAKKRAPEPRRDMTSRRVRNSTSPTFFIGFLTVLALAAQSGSHGLPDVPVPGENPITENKRVLGKILFWEEQLSSDNAVACGTCHAIDFAGADSRVGMHPGADGILGNADDVFGSPGVVHRDVTNAPIEDPIFGFDPQVTARSAPNFFGGLWSPEVFWDGSAGGIFTDPIDGTTVLIDGGGALENQAVRPILSSVEMAKDGRTWIDVTEKLDASTPLAFATNLPPDMTAAISANPTYAALFTAAFGDSAITPARIVFALATYERTLVADQTPWDAFQAGDSNALTSSQKTGWSFFQTSSCALCHVAPLFTDETFRNIGTRDPAEDLGRADVTLLADDNGRFKVPTVRNVGLKQTFLHTGEVTTLAAIMTFYAPGGQGSLENIDPLMPIEFSPQVEAAMVDFMANGLLDPRVAAATFPFDQPTIEASGALPVPEPSLSSGIWLGGVFSLTLGRRRQRKCRASHRSKHRASLSYTAL
jgi:cytochrome c peroxidase